MQAKDSSNTSLSQEELSRYARHLNLPEIGIAGQQRLKAGSVLCAGAGGLGSPILLYLAAAGIGRIGIVDCDKVETSNLQRQVVHSSNCIGEAKTESARNRILEINPNCKVDMYQKRLCNDNILQIISPYDIVCDCTDNFPSKYLINDACVILEKPNIYGAIQQFEGQASVFNLNSNSPNYRDLVPIPPPPNEIPTCAAGGVLGVLPGLIGMIQAIETIKIIANIGEPLNGRILVFDALTMKFRELNLEPNVNTIKADGLINYKEFCGLNHKSNYRSSTFTGESISPKNLELIINSGENDFAIVDVRTQKEADASSIRGSELIPLDSIKNGKSIEKLRAISLEKKIYIYCASGKRSKQAINELSKHGIHSINIDGGIQAWNEQI